MNMKFLGMLVLRSPLLSTIPKNLITNELPAVKKLFIQLCTLKHRQTQTHRMLMLTQVSV